MVNKGPSKLWHHDIPAGHGVRIGDTVIVSRRGRARLEFHLPHGERVTKLTPEDLQKDSGQ